jgi:hypothetical protein
MVDKGGFTGGGRFTIDRGSSDSRSFMIGRGSRPSTVRTVRIKRDQAYAWAPPGKSNRR